MTSIERLSVAGLMALSGAVGFGGAVYVRPLQPSQQPLAMAPIPIVPPIRTVTWFKAHQDEMKVELAACQDNPGVAMHDAECINADEAKDKLSLDKELAQARANGVLK